MMIRTLTAVSPLYCTHCWR